MELSPRTPRRHGRRGTSPEMSLSARRLPSNSTRTPTVSISSERHFSRLAEMYPSPDGRLTEPVMRICALT